MASSLHILNGDGLKTAFQSTQLPGDIVVWREALSTGPVKAEVGSKEFFALREAFLGPEYPAHKLSYRNTFLPEWENLQAFPNYDEIVCWFGQDYFCQINLFAVLSWFFRQKHIPAISLVCTNTNTQNEAITCLGHLSPSELLHYYQNRKRLHQKDLQCAHEFWKVYASEDARKFNPLNLQAPNLEFLPLTIDRHKKLFPYQDHGLSYPEILLLESFAPKPLSKTDLIGQVLRKDKAYGFGDLQWNRVLDRVKSLISGHQEDKLMLQARAHKVLEGQEKFQRNGEVVWNGGARMRYFVYHPENQALSTL